MMDEINIDDFEEFLKTQADKHRMYPDDKVWRNINQQLHGNSRWPALTFAAFLTGAILIAGMLFLHPNKELFKLSQTNLAPKQPETIVIAEREPIPSQPGAINITKVKPSNGKVPIYPYHYTNTKASNVDAKENGTLAILQDANLQSITVSSGSVTTVPEVQLNVGSGIKPTFKVAGKGVIEALNPLSTKVATLETHDDDDVVNILTSEEEKTAVLKTLPISEGKLADEKVAKIEKVKVPKHLKLQIYGGSNISYRLLSEPTSYDYHFPYNPVLTGNPRSNVNNAVKQKPAVGFEIGASLAYPLTPTLSIKAGLQFNYRQYNIDAYASSRAEPSVLWLNNSGGRDSTIVYSAIRNGDGSKPLSLRNRYFQIGIPIGVDWTIAQSRKMYVTLGATIQPTYQLNTDMYMVTSDYKGYTQQSEMVRKFNFNGSVEAMMNFKTGAVNWQVGPQVRYQVMPTQIQSYSVHEHLIDYGIKVGIIKQLK